MQIGAKNRREKMQIGVEIAPNDANQPWFWKGAKFMQIVWEPRAQIAGKIVRWFSSALRNNVWKFARLGYTWRALPISVVWLPEPSDLHKFGPFP